MPLTIPNLLPKHSSDAASQGSSLIISENYLAPALASRFGLPSTECLYQSLVETGLSSSNANELRSVYKVFLQAVDMQITRNKEPAVTTSRLDSQEPLLEQCTLAEASGDIQAESIKVEPKSNSEPERLVHEAIPPTNEETVTNRPPRRGKSLNPYPNKLEKRNLANTTGLTFAQFQNRRYRLGKTPWLRNHLLASRRRDERYVKLPDGQTDPPNGRQSLGTSPSLSTGKEPKVAPETHDEDGRTSLSEATSHPFAKEVKDTSMEPAAGSGDQRLPILLNQETRTDRSYFEKIIDVPADTPPVAFSTDSSTFLDIFNPLGPNDDNPINRPYPSVYMPFDVEDRPFSSATRSTVDDKQLFSFPQTLWKRTGVHNPSSYVPTKQDYKSLFHSFKGLALGATQRSGRHRSTGARRRRVIAHH
ncbi:hypothetical protein SISNIDRAFT_466200 [Sistotremastrum niveocremeum HHB9708]|uniref:Uncharacterized protein n=1 Tax=Sistotremastrum niveocremeum HHB9708 TaxID=1314777 RepID=A0A164UQN4_9AGAM|nr:hypothetical protein SISNIDRAFT_466200 [Sistotremastrum niveocremeum HHB9708]